MTTRAVEQFDEWESSRFSDGYRGLQTLADRDFSGVIEAGTAKLCMLNGTAVGILEGDIDDFEDASGTAYASPSPALPLLALMQERNNEVRAKYYTEDTPVEDVDETLADGGFTGFIQLSENVLSGDYYVVYHQGRSMAVAWVGNTGELLTDDEAFDRANGEVGIFEVRPAELEPVGIPDPDSGTAGAAGGDTSEASEAGASAAGAGAAGAVTDDGRNASADTDDAAVDAAAVDDDGGDQFADDVADATDGAAKRNESEPSETAVASDADRAGPAGETTASSDDTAVDEIAGAETADTESVSETEARADADAGSGGEESRTDAGRSGGETVTDERAAEETSDVAARKSDEAARNRTERSGTASRENPAHDTDREDSTDARRRDRDSAGRTTESQSDSGGDRTSDTGRDRTDRTDRADRNRTDRTDRDRSEREHTDRTNRPESSRETDARTADTGRETGRERSDSTADQSERTPEASGRGETAGRSGAGDAGVPGRSGDSGATGRTGDSGTAGRTGETGGAGARAGGAADQLATHTIPSLDPSRTTTASGDADASASPEEPPTPEPTDSAVAPSAEERTEPSPRTEPEPSSARERERTGGQDQPATDASESRGDRSGVSSRSAESTGADSSARVKDLEAELAERDAAIQELEADLSAAESDREDLRTQLDDVRAERDDLRAQIEDLEAERDQLASERDSLASEVGDLEADVERLESQIDEIETEFGAAVDADRRISPGEALDQTNLFVRYESKGKATLETAHAGESTREEVAKNLGLEYHTQFEHENVSVSGRPFDEFLRETIQFQFVTWVINDLLYEIQDTGKISALEDLYDAIPQIDRAELNGVVATEYTEDGQERRSQESFDVVMRDRMGNALLTANMNDSRQAATESMMSSLVTASSHVGESTETLGASFLVTSSFFEPEALETAAEATSGGLLSRDKRESFVKLSRKQGYHLCLVEAREDKFHLAVPEL